MFYTKLLLTNIKSIKLLLLKIGIILLIQVFVIKQIVNKLKITFCKKGNASFQKIAFNIELEDRIE